VGPVKRGALSLCSTAKRKGVRERILRVKWLSLTLKKDLKIKGEVII